MRCRIDASKEGIREIRGGHEEGERAPCEEEEE